MLMESYYHYLKHLIILLLIQTKSLKLKFIKLKKTVNSKIKQLQLIKIVIVIETFKSQKKSRTNQQPVLPDDHISKYY